LLDSLALVQQKKVIVYDVSSLTLEIMIENTLVQQLSSLLTPALPYLMGAATITGKKAIDGVGGNIGEEAWNKAQQVWDKLRPWVYKKPETVAAMKEVADNPNDPIYANALPLNLKKLLEEMPAETVSEIRNTVISRTRSESHIVSADHGGVAIGGNVSGGSINAGYYMLRKEPE
jgi:hypothetical protein